MFDVLDLISVIGVTAPEPLPRSNSNEKKKDREGT